jgi:hypothetical protein
MKRKKARQSSRWDGPPSGRQVGRKGAVNCQRYVIENLYLCRHPRRGAQKSPQGASIYLGVQVAFLH